MDGSLLSHKESNWPGGKPRDQSACPEVEDRDRWPRLGSEPGSQREGEGEQPQGTRARGKARERAAAPTAAHSASARACASTQHQLDTGGMGIA
eukprot:gene15286-biopygen10087